MTRCPHCGNDHNTKLEPDARCSKCNWTPSEDRCWVAVARMASLAEAGFFADALEAHGLSARVFHRQDFNALDGYWESYYELAAQRGDSASAVTLLREQLAALGGDSNDDEFDNLPRGYNFSASRLAHVWTPLICAALAGGFAYWVGRTGMGRFMDTREPVTSLWHVVAESPPFWSEPQRGTPRRCLRFDAASQSVYLEEDFDGDGQVDHQRQFRAVP